jgi:hypothetical protein
LALGISCRYDAKNCIAVLPILKFLELANLLWPAIALRKPGLRLTLFVIPSASFMELFTVKLGRNYSEKKLVKSVFHVC